MLSYFNKHSHFKLSAICTLLGLSLVGCSATSSIGSKKTVEVSNAQTIEVNLVSDQGIGEKIGTISFMDSTQGLVVKTNLDKLSPGYHGFHIHEKGSCEAALKDGKMGAALAAGGHFNPHNTPHHGTPNDGHLGDLPVLNVEANGQAKTTVIAPRLKLADVQGLAIMIHAGGDNYSDTPKPLGGGGDRVACGVIR